MKKTLLWVVSEFMNKHGKKKSRGKCSLWKSISVKRDLNLMSYTRKDHKYEVEFIGHLGKWMIMKWKWNVANKT